MLKVPVFSLTPLLKSFYIEQTGTKRISIKEYRAISKSEKKLKKSISDPVKWVFVEYNGKQSPVLLKKSGDDHVFMTGPLRFKKAKTEKDLEYWKKKLLAILKDQDLGKSLEEILFPGVMLKSLSKETLNLLLKARGFAPGTVRTWSGKEYKKMSSGKWVRTYKEGESRGAKQAIRNVMKKIQNASSMEDLVEIIKENAARFQDEDGKMLPTVKEFLAIARATEPGKKTGKQEELLTGPEKTFYDSLKQGQEVTLGMFYSDLPKGTKGKVMKKYIPKNAKDESDVWVKLNLGENLSGQKLTKTVPLNTLEGYPSDKQELDKQALEAELKTYLDIEKDISRTAEQYQEAMATEDQEEMQRTEKRIDLLEEKLRDQVKMAAQAYKVSEEEFITLLNTYSETGRSMGDVIEKIESMKNKDIPSQPKNEKQVKEGQSKESSETSESAETKQYYDTIVNWIQAPVSKTRDFRNTAMSIDGTISGSKNKLEAVESIDKNLSPIKEKHLYRGTTNEAWKKVQKGDEINTGIASFSKSQDVASEFSGDSKIILRYTPPPVGKGIDVHSMIEDLSLKSEWGLRELNTENYQKEQEVILRSKALKVKDISQQKMDDGVEYTVIDVSVVPSAVVKAIDEKSYLRDLSDDFNNKLVKR